MYMSFFERKLFTIYNYKQNENKHKVYIVFSLSFKEANVCAHWFFFKAQLSVDANTVFRKCS